MPDLTISKPARSDLRKIWRDSVEQWGKDVARNYIRQLDAKMLALADRPDRGRACDEIRQGYFKASCESHMIFFKRVDNGIDVARILHQAMDYQRHL